ncbi:YtxH domain-containing protein [Aerococcus kribbianus]|uniref:YtxH domain-containing protein n=1 Tax=Aerococcus kribbianus TaxID=2999064 RepID=A0A9X3FNQ6_9LACT|nr:MULTISPECIES: YtxH domain-containing protein [unclassified Aerococcus]MCZ0717791.1 YtxH domain-containing protein [Aerococcus sp. YH-aer221]MCZ0726078.1 YtxH domain-containing protein [Aerococcus sp. YH-aer222]
MNGKKFASGLIWGVLLGGGYALLKTPHAGKKNREIIKDYADNLSDAAHDMQGSIAQAQNAVTDLSQQGISSAKIARDEINFAIQDFQRTAVPQYNDMQKKINQFHNDMESAQIKFQKN